MDMGLAPLSFLFLLLVASLSSIPCAESKFSTNVGVNYGQLGNNLPSPTKSAYLIKNILKAKRVKLYDANPQILNSLKNTGLQLSIMVPNDLIVNISKTQSISDDWVKSNVVPFLPDTKIRYLMVGNEVVGNPFAGKPTWLALVPAMIRIRRSLKKYEVGKIKVGTTVSMDVLETSFPPSNGTFRSEFTGSVIEPMLRFLNRTKSFLFLDAYPYFPWSQDPVNVDLSYALFEPKNNFTYSDSKTGLVYTNLFDQMVDSVYFAMERVGFPDIRIWIAETGWPSGGDVDQIGCNVHNAATYNRNLIKKLTAEPPVGTPARPGRPIGSFLFALYNENRKTGPTTERNFGLLYPNGSRVYEVDLSGETASYSGVLPPPTNNAPYKGPVWCVAVKGANRTELASALAYACSQGNKTCDPIGPGRECFKPDSLRWHASYAFSSYWAQERKVGGTCYFDGLAIQTIKNPSFGHCKFPSVTL